jgi:hypothetical protein
LANGEGIRFFGNPRALLVLAGITLSLALCGLLSYTVGSATDADAGGWGLAQNILFPLGNAIFLTGVLVGLAALVVPQWKDSPAHAERVFHLMVFAAITVVILGVGVTITIVGRSFDWHASDWYTAGQVFLRLANEVFRAGVLLGLGYLSLRWAKSVE